MKYKNNILEKIIYYFIIFSPLVDLINGVSKYYSISGIGVSLLYKGLILILMIFFFLIQTKKNRILIYIPFLTLLLSSKFLYQLSNLSIEFIWIVKIYFFMLVLAFMKQTINSNFNKVDLYFYILTATIIFNLLGSFLFDFGYSSYKGSHLGNVGFYFAPNELGGLLVATSTYWAMITISKQNITIFIFIFIFIFLNAAVTIMKASTVGVLFVFTFTPLIYFYSTIHKFRLNKWITTRLIIFFGILVILLPIAFDYVYYTLDAKSRLEYAFSHGVVGGLMSNRNVWAEQMINYFIDNITIYNFFFGYSYEVAFTNFGNRSEIDAVDIYFSFGFVGFFLIYGFWIQLLYRLIKLNNRYSPFVAFSAILIFSLSLTSGHIINSGLGAIPFAVLFSLAFLAHSPSKRIVKG